MIRKAVLPSIAALASLLFACGATLRLFPEMSEISDFEVVQVVGIDKKGDGVEVTLVADRESKQGGENASGAGMTGIMSFEGLTVSDAIGKMNLYSDKRRHLGYVDYLLIDESAARDDIAKYLDFFTREYETRYSMFVFVARGVTSKELLRAAASANRRMAGVLTNIDEATKELSCSRMLRLIDLAAMLGDGSEAAVIPAITCEDTGFAKVVGAEKPEKAAVPDGFAFIRDRKLAGFYDGGLAQAYNILTGRARAMPLSVKAEDGEYSALEILQYRVNFKTFWDGKTLAGVRYDITAEANITEQSGRKNVFTDAGLKALEDGAAELIRRETRAVADKSALLGRDGFELGRRVRMKNPVKWAGIADGWSELFPKLDVEIDVKCVISRSYDLRERIGAND
jgi:spore germination protein KC